MRLAIALLLITGARAGAQTNCGILHPEIGVFICYPNPAANPADANIPDTFHFSAQANPAEGQTIRRYSIVIDGRVAYESRLPAPLKKLSIETNLKAPVTTTPHNLALVVYGVGSAEVSGLHTRESSDSMLCDPFSRTDPGACNLSKPPAPLRWQANIGNNKQYQPADAYVATLQTYSRNLKRLEADASDAIALDGHGNLYTASHVLSDLELRKYSPDGGVVYDSLVRSCGDGFVQVSAIAATDSGLVWIAANTSACFKVSGSAEQRGGMRAILILVDTTKPSAVAPPYLTWLAQSEYRVTSIRADSQGNAYVAGVTGDANFPHQTVLDAAARTSAPEGREFGFVCVLSKSGSILWSTLLRHLSPVALSAGAAGNVLVAGRGTGGAIVIEIAERGQRLSWSARSGATEAQEFRAVSTTPNGEWVLLAGASSASQGHGQKTFFASVPVCRTDAFDFHPAPERASEETPGIALGAALDSVAGTWLGRSPPACPPPA